MSVLCPTDAPGRYCWVSLPKMKFSILSCCYNQDAFLKDCIRSVAGQTYDNWEHIIVNDNSSDGSKAILDKINDSRVKIIHNDHRKYCSSSYAVALSHATGDIVGIVDGDDVLKNNAMDVVLKRYIRHPDVQFIYTQHYWCNTSLKIKRSGVSSAPKKGKSLAEMTQIGRHCFSHWRTFRRSLADKGVLFPEGLEVSVDKNLGFALEELGKGAFLPKKLYYYRYYKGNMSLIQGGNQRRTTIRLAKMFLEKRKARKMVVFPIVEIS